ncbi:TolC family protein [Cyclobacterium marinum]|uniref:TolC family protein n=1 Tax=Cyclobacterium marinum TaxID=104 RepID=UPI0011EBEFEB|nr:TolC family protein [Cyclobacterium marinum]MBI0400667.1 TolC family protein [Cyclobacterium marinum]
MMNNIRSGKLILILLLFSLATKAQDTLQLSREQAEALFLKDNLRLIAEKLNISQAEAMATQANLWPNPSFTLDQVNFWATNAQTGGKEVIPSLGGLPTNQQFGFGIEQIILTARKRKKLVALEEVSVEKSKQYFEDLLRNLKIEFRNQLTRLQYLQFSKSIYQNQLNSIRLLTIAYKNQVEEGNVSQGEFIRLKAMELEIAKTINEFNQEVNKAQKELKVFMHLPATTHLQITDEGFLKDTEQFSQLALNDIIEQAKIHRPDYRITQLEETYYNNLHAFEKAQRIPNLTLSSAYDRGGNAMLDFVGFGVSMDLPFFNRNQGNIRHAQIGIKKSKILRKEKTLKIENEIVLSYQNLSNAVFFLDEIASDYESTLDGLLTSYTQNFIERNISMLEYLDFLEAYLENKKVILEAGKDVNEMAEELNYTVGMDLIK